MTTPLTPALALAYVRELSADVVAAAVLDETGALLAGPEPLAAPARALLENARGALIEGATDAGNAVEAVITTIRNALASGEDVNFTGFGKFHVAERGAREGRNPRTGATMTIAASRVPRFTAGSGLKSAVK
jgi:DNA-binding protein HU-beta